MDKLYTVLEIEKLKESSFMQGFSLCSILMTLIILGIEYFS